MTDDEMNCLYTKVPISAEMIAEIEEFQKVEVEMTRELLKIIGEAWRQK